MFWSDFRPGIYHEFGSVFRIPYYPRYRMQAWSIRYWLIWAVPDFTTISIFSEIPFFRPQGKPLAPQNPLKSGKASGSHGLCCSEDIRFPRQSRRTPFSSSAAMDHWLSVYSGSVSTQCPLRQFSRVNQFGIFWTSLDWSHIHRPDLAKIQARFHREIPLYRSPAVPGMGNSQIPSWIQTVFMVVFQEPAACSNPRSFYKRSPDSLEPAKYWHPIDPFLKNWRKSASQLFFLISPFEVFFIEVLEE